MQKPNRTLQGLENCKKAKAAWIENNRESIKQKSKVYRVLNKEVCNAKQRIAYRKHPEKWRAQWLVREAVRKGTLVRKPCIFCGIDNTHGHHEDYTKPLEVLWLCQSCHQQLHSGRRLLTCLNR